MDYDKIRHIEEYEDRLKAIQNLPDYDERLNLIKSWLGQFNFINAKAVPRAQRRIDTNRRVKRDQAKCIEHWENLAKGWEDKIERCLAGEPLDQVKGKVKVETSMPPSMRHSKRYALHQQRLNKKRAKRRAKREAEKQKEASVE